MAKQSFKELIEGDTPVLVDFFATWCGPCQTMSPILKDFATQVGDKVRVIKIDIDQNPQVAQTYRVQSVPTLILFKNGNPLWRQSGVVPKNQLVQIINQLAKT